MQSHVVEDPTPVRTAVRFPLHLEIVLTTPQGDYKAVTHDVSANGMLFFADDLPAIGRVLSSG